MDPGRDPPFVPGSALPGTPASARSRRASPVLRFSRSLSGAARAPPCPSSHPASPIPAPRAGARWPRHCPVVTMRISALPGGTRRAVPVAAAGREGTPAGTPRTQTPLAQRSCPTAGAGSPTGPSSGTAPSHPTSRAKTPLPIPPPAGAPALACHSGLRVPGPQSPRRHESHGSAPRQRLGGTGAPAWMRVPQPRGIEPRGVGLAPDPGGCHTGGNDALIGWVCTEPAALTLEPRSPSAGPVPLGCLWGVFRVCLGVPPGYPRGAMGVSLVASGVLLECLLGVSGVPSG